MGIYQYPKDFLSIMEQIDIPLHFQALVTLFHIPKKLF